VVTEKIWRAHQIRASRRRNTPHLQTVVSRQIVALRGPGLQPAQTVLWTTDAAIWEP